MAHKQKKPTRKERVQQHQAVINQRRAEKGWISPQERTRQRDELAEDIKPFLSSLQTGSDESDIEQLMLSLMDSAEIAEEPEFEKILIDPSRAVQTYINVAKEMGFAEPEQLDQLPEEEQEDQTFEIIAGATRRLLDNELRQEIIDALNNLRLRQKRSGQRTAVGKTAALQSFLSDRKAKEFWPMIGLTQAITHRSIEAGFQLWETSTEVLGEDDVEEEQAPQSLFEKVAQSGVAQKLSGALAKVPGLRGFLEKQVDQIWEEGEQAVFSGELYLGLYTQEELLAGVDIFKTVIDLDGEPVPPSKLDPADLQAKSQALFTQIEAYLTQQLTSERVNELRAQVKELSNMPDFPKKYASFLLMLNQYLADELAVENEFPFLVRAFFGEIRAAATSAAQEAAED